MRMWVEIFLVIIILLLLGWILSSGGGVSKRRRLSREVDELRGEARRLRDANEALRSSSGVGARTQARRFGNLFELVRDLEGLRCALAGSSVCQKMLTQKYGVPPGPELLERVLAKQPGMDLGAKWKLANELLVGEVGRAILRGMDSGVSIEGAASNAGVPLTVARGQVKRLQVLGYLDAHLKPTRRGREAMA